MISHRTLGILSLALLLLSPISMAFLPDQRSTVVAGENESYMGTVLEVRENQVVLSIGSGDRRSFDVAADTMVFVQNEEAALGDVKPGYTATVMAVEENGAATATMIDAQPQH